MKILFLSDWGCSIPLAMHCQDNGHETKFYIDNEDSQDVGEGFVPHIKDYKPHVSWADLVISDHTIFGKINDEIRDKGKPVIGGTKMTDALEEDRSMGQKLFKAVGMTVLDSHDFTSIEEAMAYIEDNPKAYVVKLSGELQNDKTSTFVGESEHGLDVIAVLEHMNEKMGKKVKTVEIQERVKGLEVAVSGFFNGEKFVGPCLVNFEHKKLMPGPTSSGWGPNTSEMGTSGKWCGQDTELFKCVLEPMIKPLKEMGYHGVFDINNIIVKEDDEVCIYPLEMTNRFGWPALPMMIETLKENDLAEFLLDLASGKEFDLSYSNTFSICLVIGMPPLPYNNDEIFEKYSKDLPILFKDGPQEGIYPCEAKLEGEELWRVAGSEGCIAVVAAGGESIEDCRELVYDLSDEIMVPNKMVRDDIGRTTEDSFKELEELGLLEAKEEVEA